MAGKGIELANAYINIVPSTKDIAPAVKSALGDVGKHGANAGKSMGDKFTGAIGKSMKWGAASVGVAAGGALAGSFAKGMGRLTSIDAAEKKLVGLGNSAKDVEGIMKNALASVDGTAFGMGEAATVASQVVASGIKPGKELEKVLTTVGDVAAITGDSMEGMGMIFGSVAARGKLMGDDLMQLRSRGLPVMDILAESLGKTTAEVEEMASKGEISFDIFETAMREKMGGAAQAMGDTFQGSIANVGAAMGRFGEAMLKPFFDNSPKVISAVRKTFNDMTDAVKPVSAELSEKLAPVMGNIAGVIEKRIAPALGSATGAVGEFVLKLTEKAIDSDIWERLGSSFEKLGNLAQNIWPDVSRLFEAFGTIGANISVAVWEALVNVLNALAPLVTTVLVPLVETVAKFAENDPGAVQAIVTAFLGFKTIGAVAGPMKTFGSTAKTVGGAMKFLGESFKGAGVAGGLVNVMGGFKSANPIIAAMGGAVGKATGALAKLSPVLKVVGAGLKIFGKVVVGALTFNPIITGLVAVGAALTLFFTKTETGRKLLADFGTFISNAWESTTEAIGRGVDWISEKFNGFMSFMSDMGELFKLGWDASKLAIETFVDSATEKWNMFATVMQAGWELVKTLVVDVFISAWAGIVTAFQNVTTKLGNAWTVYSTLMSTVWNLIKTTVIDAFTRAWNFAVALFRTATTGLSIAWQATSDKFANIWGVIKSVVVDAFTNAWNRTAAFFTNTVEGMKAKFSSFRDHAGNVISAVKGFFESFANKVKETSSRAIDAVKSIPTGIKNAFKGAATWLVDAGRDMISGLIDGIKSMAGKVGDAVRWVVPDRFEKYVPGLHFGGLAGFARGGVLPDIPGISRSERDPILGYSRERKQPIARIEPGEFVVNRDATAKHLPLLYAINEGKYDSSKVDGLPGYSGGGVIGAMTKLVKAAFPMLQVTSAYRPGDSGYHGRGLAVDFSNGTGNTPQQLALARAINRVYPESAQLIYAAPGWSGNIYEGRPAGAMDTGIYKTAQAGRHDHHVHWAMKTPPTKPLDGAGMSGSPASAMQSMPPMKWSEKGLTYNAVRAARALALKFPQIQAIGGYRPVDPYPDHPSGRALDVMTYSDMSLGDKVKNFLFAHNFKMEYALWRQAQWNSASASSPMADRGSPTQNHMDHVHAYFAASPRATGNETYPPIGLSGVSAAGVDFDPDTVSPSESKLAAKEFQVDWGTASNLASEYDKEQHRKKQLKRFTAGIFDTGGIMHHGTAAVNLSGKPERVLDPRMTTAFEKFVAYVPGLADAIEKFAGTDWNVVGQEMAAAFHGEDFGYGEMAKVFGEEVGERIADSLAFIGYQIRDMQDGSNMRAYLSSMSASEGLDLTGRVGALFGGGKVSAALSGVAKGYEALQDAAVSQVDALDAVKQAEKNLVEARAQAKDITADANATEEDKAKATESVTAAEAEHTKALGVVKMAAKATGQAQIAMALEVAEVVVKAVEWVFAKVQDVFAGIVTAWNTIGDMFGAIAEYQNVLRGFREDVTRLALDQALAQIQLAAAYRKVRMTAWDGVTAQLQGLVEVAEAQAAFDESLQADIAAANMAYKGLSVGVDQFRHNVFTSFDEITAANVEWSDKTWSLWWNLQAARTGGLIAEQQAQKDLLEAQYDSILAAVDLKSATAELGKAAEKLAIASGEAFGMSQVEATTAERWAKLQGERAELMAQQARGRNIFFWNWGAVEERQRRIDQIDAETRELEARDDFNIDAQTKRKAKKLSTRAGVMGFFGAGDEVAGMVKNSALGDASRTLEKMKWESNLVDIKAQDDEFRREIERKKTEIDRKKVVEPIDLMLQALKSEQDAQKTYSQMYKTDNEHVRKALMDLAKQQETTAQNIESMARTVEKDSKQPITVNLQGNQFDADAVERTLAELGIRVNRIENPRPTGATVAASRR